MTCDGNVSLNVETAQSYTLLVEVEVRAVGSAECTSVNPWSG